MHRAFTATLRSPFSKQMFLQFRRLNEYKREPTLMPAVLEAWREAQTFPPKGPCAIRTAAAVTAFYPPLRDLQKQLSSVAAGEG